MIEDSGHFVLVNGGTKKQRNLIEDITWWFCDKYFSRFKYFNIYTFIYFDNSFIS